MDEHQIQPDRRPVLLFAFANDERPGRRLGGLRRELEEIRRALARAERDGSCEVVVRESTTPAELVEVLEDPRYRRRLTAIHFAGHASGSRLLFEGEHEPIPAHIRGLAPLLGELESLVLVFLNGCATLAQGERLVRAGIPAVIATEHAMEDEQAQCFSADFYRALGGGSSLSEAFGRAFAQAQCFVPAAGSTRDLALAPRDEEPNVEWRLLLADPRGDAKDWGLSTAVDDPLFGLPAPVGGVLPQAPFMGLRRFTARESAVFFGRGRAIRNLHGDVTDPSLPPVVVIHGASGVGKSSLLEAGLLPRIEASHEVHDLRLERGQDPEGLLRHVLGDAGSSVDLATAWCERERERGRPVMICIDQLEVLIVEEGGTRAFSRLVQALVPLGGPGRPRGKLLLGLRKEWFAELRNELRRHAIEWHEHFVEPLGRDDIEEVVLGPTRTASLRARYGITCEDGLARRIADDLSRDRGSAIAPTLQILLTRMWERAEPLLTSMDGRARRRFTREMYDELRRDGLALSDFVDRQLEELRGTHAEALTSGLVLDLLYRHTTPRGTAASTSHGELRESYAHCWPVVEELVERCVSLYLLQVVTDARGLEVGVRLAHDTLAPIVRDRCARSRSPGQAAARLLAARMGMSEASGRSRLLDEHDLAQVETAQSGMRRWTEDEERLVTESRRRRKWAVWSRRGRLAVVLASLAVAVVALVWRELEPDEPVVQSLFAIATPPEPPTSAPGEGRPADEAELEAKVQVLEQEALVPERETAMGEPEAEVPGGSSEPKCDVRRVTPLTGVKHPSIAAVAVTPDGEQLAMGMAGHQWAFVLDRESPTDVSEIGTANWVNSMVWSPTGGYLAIGEDGGGVELVIRERASYGKPVSCKGHDDSINTLAFSADGNVLLTGSSKGRVVAYDGRTCVPLGDFTVEGAIHGIQEIRKGPASEWLLAGKSGLLAWRVAGASPSWLPGKNAATKAIADVAGDGRLIAAGHRLQLWHGAHGRLFDKDHGPVAEAVFVDEQEGFVITRSSKTVMLWRLEAEALVWLDTWPHESIITDMAVYPDRQDMLVVTKAGLVHWLQRRGEKLVEERPLHLEAKGGGEIVLDPQHPPRYFAVGDHGGQISLVTLPSRRQAARKCLLNDVLQQNPTPG